MWKELIVRPFSLTGKGACHSKTLFTRKKPDECNFHRIIFSEKLLFLLMIDIFLPTSKRILSARDDLHVRRKYIRLIEPVHLEIVFNLDYRLFFRAKLYNDLVWYVINIEYNYRLHVLPHMKPLVAVDQAYTGICYGIL